MTLIQIQNEEKKIYIFDLLELKFSCNDFFKLILESKSILKLGFDFRNDTDAFYAQLGIFPTNVLDLQLVEYYFTHNLSSKNDYQLVSYFKEKVKDGKCSWPDLYLKGLKKNTNFNKSQMDYDFKKRPLTKNQLSYCASDVSQIYKLYDEFSELINKSNKLEFLLKASQKYIHLYREKKHRTYDKYEHNKIIALNVFLSGTHTQQCEKCGFNVEILFYNKFKSECMKCWLQKMLLDRERNISKSNHDCYDDFSDYILYSPFNFNSGGMFYNHNYDYDDYSDIYHCYGSD